MKLIWKTFHPTNSAAYYGEQIFMHSLLSDFEQIICGPELSFNERFQTSDGAIIGIRACDNLGYIDQFNHYLKQFKWCVVIVTGNENGSDFYNKIEHPNCKVWLQTPRGEDMADYYLPLGYPTLDYPHIKDDQTLKKRHYDWSFSGQVTHTRRRDCVKVLRNMPNGKLIETNSFGSGLAYPDYVELMRDSKVVFCPGGPSTPDTFRIYEALELGCIPVVDMESGSNKEPFDYWTKVFGWVPFPTIRYWDTAPKVLADLLSSEEKYIQKQQEVSSWWRMYKEKVVSDLNQQIVGDLFNYLEEHKL